MMTNVHVTDGLKIMSPVSSRSIVSNMSSGSGLVKLYKSGAYNGDNVISTYISNKLHVAVET